MTGSPAFRRLWHGRPGCPGARLPLVRFASLSTGKDGDKRQGGRTGAPWGNTFRFRRHGCGDRRLVLAIADRSPWPAERIGNPRAGEIRRDGSQPRPADDQPLPFRFPGDRAQRTRLTPRHDSGRARDVRAWAGLQDARDDQAHRFLRILPDKRGGCGFSVQTWFIPALSAGLEEQADAAFHDSVGVTKPAAKAESPRLAPSRGAERCPRPDR